jgi:hypothetical protein
VLDPAFALEPGLRNPVFQFPPGSEIYDRYRTLILWALFGECSLLMITPRSPTYLAAKILREALLAYLVGGRFKCPIFYLGTRPRTIGYEKALRLRRFELLVSWTFKRLIFHHDSDPFFGTELTLVIIRHY